MSSGARFQNICPAGMEDDYDEDYSTVSIKKTCENMKITVVPDITTNAGLNGLSFNAKLEPDINEWFEQIKSIWFNFKRGPALTHKLLTFFSSCSNPFLYSLKFYANCAGINSAKTNSLAYAILEELHNFKKSSKIIVAHYVDDNLKMVAFNFVKKQGQQNLFKIVSNTFDLFSSKHIFVDKIKELIAEQYYKEACQLAYEIHLYDEFTIYEIVLPLILQDKISIAEEYLNKAKHLQRPIIELLDSLLDKSSSLQNRCSYFITQYNYTDVKLNKLQPRPLTKLISRLVKNYKLPNDVMPNVLKMKNYGALQFLIYKKYNEKSLNQDSWEEMVKETVSQDSSELQLELIDNCSFNRDYSEAINWAKYYNISEDDLPVLVRDYIHGHNIPQNAKQENWDGTDYNNLPQITIELNHNLSIAEQNIIIVDTRDKFYKMLNYLSVQNLIAFDAEWKPTFCSTNEVALIQLATRQYIYLIDVILLSIDNKDWNKLGRNIFNNMEILKLCFSPSTDLTMFQKTIPALSLSSLSLSSYLDLQEFWLKLNSIPNFKFPYEGDIEGSSLSALVKLCMGKKLDKSNQFSNWEKRPLRNDQLIYAALDAFCLIEIHDVIETQVNKIGHDYKELIENFLVEKKSKIVLKRGSQSSSQKRYEANLSLPNEPNSIKIGISDIKFVCDIMLEGLSKALRKYGIDAISINVKDGADQCIRIAMQEKRFILTKGNFYNRCVQYVPMGHCYSVFSDIIDIQLEEVLNYFNITIKPENIFSRCQICNCDEFILISRNEMNELINNVGDSSSSDIIYSIDTTNASSNSINNYETVEHQIPNEEKHRSLKLSKISPFSKFNRITSKGVHFQLSTISRDILLSVPNFFICEGCGKCYWDGTHYERVLAGHLKKIMINA